MPRRPTKQIICPYNPSHVLSEYSIHAHLYKCKYRYPGVKLHRCPHNAIHLFREWEDFDKHLFVCPNRTPLLPMPFRKPFMRIQSDPSELERETENATTNGSFPSQEEPVVSPVAFGLPDGLTITGYGTSESSSSQDNDKNEVWDDWLVEWDEPIWTDFGDVSNLTDRK